MLRVITNGMDSDSKQATKVLAALAESCSRGMALARQFESMSGVGKASFDFECYKNHDYWQYGSGGSPYVFNWYVDVALENGNTIWWTLDVQWDEDKWGIESRVEFPGHYCPNTLKEFPDRCAETIDEGS